ncbi:MAG: hypothetical protein MHM6MM_003634 [Cercozoa sp. M6MM]
MHYRDTCIAEMHVTATLVWAKALRLSPEGKICKLIFDQMFDPLTGQLRENAVRHACEEDTPGVNALVAETVMRDLFSMDENDCFGGCKRTEVVKLATQVLNRVFKEAGARKEKVTLSGRIRPRVPA